MHMKFTKFYAIIKNKHRLFAKFSPPILRNLSWILSFPADLPHFMGLILLITQCNLKSGPFLAWHDDVIKWKHFPRYWPFVRGLHRSPANSPHKGHWRGALIFFITRDSEVIMFSPCVFVCLCVSMFVTMFVRTIELWRTGATQTIFCRYIVGDV